MLDPRYFNVKFVQNHYTQNGNSYRPTKSIHLEASNWTNIFPISDEEFDALGLNQALWLFDTDFFIQGNARSFEWDELGIRIREWYTSDDDETSNDWEDSEIIDRAISSNFVQIFTINAYFDFDDIDNPVKTYLQNYDSPPLTANNFQNIVININQDKAILNDGWLFGSKTEEKEFYTNHYFQSTTSDGSLSAGHLLLAYFKLDGKTTIYKRTVFNMLELFGILGGMYEVLEVTLTILLSSTS